jgi:hypothetical protein
LGPRPGRGGAPRGGAGFGERAEGPQRMWSTAEAPKRPYAGETRGRRESATTSAGWPCSIPFTLFRKRLTPKSAK